MLKLTEFGIPKFSLKEASCIMPVLTGNIELIP